jgi:adenosylcobinamide kinase/adenosylcobinamide-phosphate guanylyltransferase
MADATGRVTLVLGGARSGKSSFAEKLAAARTIHPGVLYAATLAPYDDEMRERVVRHRLSRPASWKTVEAPYELLAGLKQGYGGESTVLVDCLTLWTTNHLMRAFGWEAAGVPEELDPDAIAKPDELEPVAVPAADFKLLEQNLIQQLDEIINWLRQENCNLILVSNEVGLGLVPPYPLGRVYRDILGRINQRTAALADEVFFCFAGIPVDIKKLQFNI